MTLAPTFKDLEGLTDQDLRDRYDEAVGAAQQPWHASFYLDELRRREATRREWLMLRLTYVVAGATLVNLIVVVVALAG